MRILSISLSISNLTNTFSTFCQFSFTLFVRNKHFLGYTPRNHEAAPGGKRSKNGMGGLQHGCIYGTFLAFFRATWLHKGLF